MVRKLVLTLAVVALVGLAAQPPAGAWGNSEKTMYLTFNRPVRLPGVTLTAGTYIFEIANPMSTADVVIVRSRDRMRHYYLGLTRPIYRPAGASDKIVTFGEAPKGEATPITAWFPAGENVGRQFLY